MDFYKVPIGFGMALAMNAPAMEAYAAMTEQQKQSILDRAHHARSEAEMRRIVESIAGATMQSQSCVGTPRERNPYCTKV